MLGALKVVSEGIIEQLLNTLRKESRVELLVAANPKPTHAL